MVSAQHLRTARPAAARRGRQFGVSALAAALVAIGLTGCGSSSGGPAASTGSTSSGGQSSSVTAAAVAQVAKLTDPNSSLFDYSSYLPTSPVKPKAGARVAIIGAALASPVVSQYSKAVAKAATIAGYIPQEFDGKFQPSVESALVNQAVQQKFAGIVLVGVTPETIASPLATAKAAGIPVVSFDGYGDGANGVTDIGIDPAAAGDAIANWIIADSGGKAKVLAVTFPAGQSGGKTSITQVGQEALIAKLKTCSGCTVSPYDIALSDVVAPGSPVYVNTLHQFAKGSINYVASGCDTCMVVMSQINSQLGRTELKTTGGIAVGATGLSMIASGQNNAMVAPVQPDQLIGLLTIDALARRLAGQTVANMTRLPEPLVVASNASKFPGSAFTPSTDYVAVFRNLWK